MRTLLLTLANASIGGGPLRPVEIWREPDGSLSTEDQRIRAAVRMQSDRSAQILLTCSEPFQMFPDLGAAAR